MRLIPAKYAQWLPFVGRLSIMILFTVGLGFMFKKWGKTEPYRYATFENKTKEIKLSDQSTITLMESSSLEVPANFENGERILFLKGGALFSIGEQEVGPISIDVIELRVDAAEAKFLLAAREQDSTVSIEVFRGQVNLSQSGQVIKAGSKALYNKNNQKLVLEQISASGR